MKKYKKNLDFSYSIGVYPTLELLESRPDKVLRVMIDPQGNKNDGIKKIESICGEKNIRIESASTSIYKISDSENAYAVGVFEKYTTDLDKTNHLVLVNPSDKGNMGTIIRTMLAYNIKNLAVIRPAVDIFDPKVVRASMGAAFKVNFRYFDSFKQYAVLYENSIYSFMTSGKIPLNQVQFKEPYSLVFGNEGAGLGEEFKKMGESVNIPQSKEVDSVNLSVAVGIAVYSASVASKT